MNPTRRSAWTLAIGFLAAYGCAAPDEPADDSATSEGAFHDKGAVDHAAIVEVTTMMLGDVPDFPTVLDPYNQSDPFRISGAYAGAFDRRLRNFDAMDGKEDWSEEQRSAWVRRVSAGNYVIVDTSKPCDFRNPHTYLEIERSRIAGREHETCGGRMPNEDALDVTVNWLIRGPRASATDPEAIHDGVDRATQTSATTFPYLAEMNGP
jgi:hypothetical protein